MLDLVLVNLTEDLDKTSALTCPPLPQLTSVQLMKSHARESRLNVFLPDIASTYCASALHYKWA